MNEVSKKNLEGAKDLLNKSFDCFVIVYQESMCGEDGKTSYDGIRFSGNLLNCIGLMEMKLEELKQYYRETGETLL